jgi:hypothetical protein
MLPRPESAIPMSIPTTQRPGRALVVAVLAAACWAVPAAGTLPAQESAQEIQKLLAEIQSTKDQTLAVRSEAIRPMKVNGAEVSPDRFRREAIFLVGAKTVEAKIAELFVAQEIQSLIASGRDAKDFEVTDEEVIADVAGVVEQFRLQNPGVEFWQAIRAQFGMDRERFLSQRKQTKLFDRVFFPGPANEWPLITKEAIMASATGGDGKQFWENIEKASFDPETNEPRDLPPFWLQLCRNWVIKQLKSWADIRFPADGLDPQFCLQVNDQTWSTEDAFQQMESGLYEQDLERAVAEVVVRETLKQELVKAGAYIDDETFRKDFQEYRKPYDDTPFNVEVIATAFKGYPSLEAFRQRWRLIRSFERMIANEINDDVLQAHADQFQAFFSDGQVNVDLIQFYARDLKTGAWKPNGLADATKRAEDAMKAIEGGAKFDDVLRERGEYYATDKEKGRLGSKSLNQLRQALRESEFSDLLLGYSLGNQLFYDAQPGQVIGPVRIWDAAFIARINNRTPPRSKPSIADERTRELVRQDYLSYRFLQWANGVVSRAKIEG